MNYLGLVILSVFLLVLGVSTRPQEEKDHDAITKQMTDATNTFSINLLKAVAEKKPGNIIISPVSVATLLSILHQAASKDSKEQLTRVLHTEPEQSRLGYKKLIQFLKTSGENGTLEFGNGAFLMVGYKVLEEFDRILDQDFQAIINFVDFSRRKQAAGIINYWVSHHTHGRIKEIITPDSINSRTRLVLVNAIYFKNLWKTPFISKYTREESFHKEDGTVIKVPMMHCDDSLKMGVIENLKSLWVEIPYVDEYFSLLVIKPHKENTMNNFLKNFTAEHLTDIINNLKTGYDSKVSVSLPKFKLNTETSFVPVLKELGVTDIFTRQSNLEGISGEHLEVSNVIQKTEIEVDEKGVTASASTGITVETISAPFPIDINGPFLVFIIDKKNSIPLFAGKIMDPTIEE